MTRAEEQRRRGFRPVRPGPGQGVLIQRADGYGYEAETLEGTLWLRKLYRRRGATVPSPIIVGPRIRAADVARPGTYDFLLQYSRTTYWTGQRRLQVPREELVGMVRSAQEEAEPFRRFDALVKAAALCRPEGLKEMLRDCVFPGFFALDPEGIVQVLLLNDQIDRDFGLLRGGYALEHYPLVEVLGSGRGMATLRDWEAGLPMNYFDTLLSILQVSTYPYIPMFHGGPFGLWLVFLLATPGRHEAGPFPLSWLHWARSEAEFGQERVDGLRALGDPDSAEYRHLSHRRYCFQAPITVEVFHELLLWMIEQLGSIVREVGDPANFEDRGSVDFTFAFEYNLSLVRVLKRVLWALSTEEPPAGKFYAFEVADLLDRIARAFGKTTNDGDFFKLLFNPAEGRERLHKVVAGAPASAREVLRRLMDALYSDLESTILESVWVPGKQRAGRVWVKAANLATEREEGAGVFVGNLMRALRNTHHGYFTRFDRSARPSRYLVLSAGDVPDSVSSLPLLWLIGLLADPHLMIGWQPLGTAMYL